MASEGHMLVSPEVEVPVIEGELVTAIRTLAGRGAGSKAIARQLGVARNTVRRYLRAAVGAGVQGRPAAKRLTEDGCREARALYEGPAGGNPVVVQRLLAEHGAAVSVRTVERAVEEAQAVNAAGNQEPPAGGDARHPAIGRPARRRRTVRWLLWGALGTAATALALFFAPPIPGRAPVPPRASPAGLAGARTIGLVLTFADGATARLGMSVGRPATIVVAGRPVSLSVEETKSGTLLRLSLAAQGDTTRQPPVLAEVKLTQGQKVSLPPSSGIVAIAWARADQNGAGTV